MKLRSLALDVLTAAGASSLVYGAHQVFPPAAFIVGGVLALALVVWAKAAR